MRLINTFYHDYPNLMIRSALDCSFISSHSFSIGLTHNWHGSEMYRFKNIMRNYIFSLSVCVCGVNIITFTILMNKMCSHKCVCVYSCIYVIESWIFDYIQI